MASETQETLYRLFATLSGGMARAAEPNLGARGASADGGMAALAQGIQSAVAGGIASGMTGGLASGGIVGAIESAVAGSTEKKKDQGGGAAEIALDVVKSGMGLVPLASLVFGLFGGGKEEPPTSMKYALPARRDFSAAETSGGLADVDYDQSGRPRAVERGAAASAGAAPQITVNVQAMDARSFLDRSGDIAAAVRDAMLNLNSINDVVTDL